MIIKRTVVHVKTENQCHQLMSVLEILGYRWSGGRLPTDSNIWKEAVLKYKIDLCISLNTDLSMEYSPVDYYEKYGHEIISFETFYAQRGPKLPNLNSRLIKCIEEVYKINQ